jgi:allantoinase
MSLRAFLSRRVVTPQGVRPAAIVVEGEKIRAVVPADQVAAQPEIRDSDIHDFGDAAILPGLVDSHVHINDPGRTQWEGFNTATRAAAAGGYTLLVDMPLNCLPATTTVAALEAKRRAARGQCRVDWAAWGGVVKDNPEDIAALAAAGVPGFKCFLIHPGIDGFTMVTEDELRAAAPRLARAALPLLVHAELPGPVDAATTRLAGADWRRYETYLQSRPEEAELSAIRMLLGLCREFDLRVHIVHLATSQALPELRAARAAGLRISVETCPHYLHLTAETIADSATLCKCAPPIRSRANREALWQGLREGIIDLWTEASGRGFALTHIARWMAEGPARLAGCHEYKGQIAPGADADFVIFEPEREFVVTEHNLFHRHPISPYLGEKLRGVVKATYLRGQPVFAEGKFPGEPIGRECRP